MPPFDFAHRSSFAALGFVLLSACRDDAGLAAPRLADLQPALAVAEQGALRDDGIDPRDTYFAFDVTTSRSVEGAGGGGGMAAAASEYETEESAYLEAGYGADGELRFNVYSDGTADPRLPPPPAVVRSVGNDVIIYDEWGTVVAEYGFDGFMEGTGLPGGDLAFGSPYGTLYNPLGHRSGGGGGVGGEPPQIEGVDPERTKVRYVRDDVLQITTISGGTVGAQASAGSGPLLSTTRTYRRRAVPTSSAGGQAALAGAVLT